MAGDRIPRNKTLGRWTGKEELAKVRVGEEAGPTKGQVYRSK